MKNMFKKVMVSVLSLVLFFTSCIKTHAYNLESYTYNDGSYQYLYYRVPYYNKYETKDLSVLLDAYATGNLNKFDLVKKLMLQCDKCSFTYYDDCTSIECYNGNDCAYIIETYKNCVSIDFYDAKYNGKDMHKLTCNGIISTEKQKCINKKRKYEITEDHFNENVTINTKGIIINGTRGIECWTSGSLKEEPGIIKLVIS